MKTAFPLEDKNSYWKNRKEGKRGQGEYPNHIISHTLPIDVKSVGPRGRKAHREQILDDRRLGR